MAKKSITYRAIISSDWNECLAPCGPFDPIIFTYPEFAPDLTTIFRHYTGNSISLGEAAQKIQRLMPRPLTSAQVDAYLDDAFTTYRGVPDLIEWCLSQHILFMINTTGMVGYFQRVFAKGLLPPIPVLSAHPMMRFPAQESDPSHVYALYEIQDKSKNTASAVRDFNIPQGKIILMGDSGGDGPHFEWGTKKDALLIGSMTKHSLSAYCQKKNIHIDFNFGVSYGPDEKRDSESEMGINFLQLTPKIEAFLDRAQTC